MKQSKLKQLIIVMLLVTNILSASDTKWQITGKIIEDKTEDVVPYAAVAIYNKSDSSIVTGTISDDNGLFIFETISQGDYYLKISFMGFIEQIIDPIVFDNSTKNIDLGTIYLKPNLEALSEVVVTSKRKAIKNTIDRQVLSV